MRREKVVRRERNDKRLWVVLKLPQADINELYKIGGAPLTYFPSGYLKKPYAVIRYRLISETDVKKEHFGKQQQAFDKVRHETITGVELITIRLGAMGTFESA